MHGLLRSTQNHKLWKELSSQVFYSLSIVILYKNSLEKLPSYRYFNSLIKGSMFVLGCQYTPFLEAPRPATPIPCHNTQESSCCTIGIHLHVLGRIILWCGKPEQDLWWQLYWWAMTTIKKDHYCKGTVLARKHLILWKGFSTMKF